MASFDVENGESGRRRELTLSLGFLLLAVTLFVLPVQLQQGISGALRSTVLAPFLWTQESLNQTRIRAAEINQLQARLDSTSAVLASQRTLLIENVQLRGLLELRERAGPTFVSASVIRSGTRGSESMFLLDVGTQDGVQVNDPVVVAEGLVGSIREVGPGTSLAMDWSHPDFRVHVMTADGEAFGVVEPRFGAFREEDRLLLNGIPFNTSLAEGMPVITSGLGPFNPRGIEVGRILSLAEAEAGWRRGYWIQPAIQPGSVTHVLVITGGEGEPVSEWTHLWSDEPLPDSLPAEDPPVDGLDRGADGDEGAPVILPPPVDLPDSLDPSGLR
ncbi:MAG: rod shape-determining protein MreC [Gemmatimonadales bacterium]|nr:MAG: rod shape-determining protein MreC [Gemmatimonadales bacterium]